MFACLAWFAVHLIRPAATLTHSHPCSFGLRPLLTANSFRRFPNGSSLPITSIPHPAFGHPLPSDGRGNIFCGTFSRRRCLRTARLGSRPPAHQHRANFHYAFSAVQEAGLKVRTYAASAAISATDNFLWNAGIMWGPVLMAWIKSASEVSFCHRALVKFCAPTSQP